MQIQEDIVGIVKDAVNRLIKVDGLRGSVHVQTPLMYPSGSLVGVIVTMEPDGFSISDRGRAWEEAKNLKATRSFNSHATVIAKDAGVSFEGGAFGIRSVLPQHLSGAIATLANVAQGAAILAANRQAVVDANAAEERLIQRLSKLFGHIQVHQPIIGASGTEWDVDAIVKADDKVVLFESVLPRRQSIYAAVAKFHDIALAPEAPRRIAVVPNREDLGSMLGVLSQAASVVEDRTTDANLIRMAFAA